MTDTEAARPISSGSRRPAPCRSSGARPRPSPRAGRLSACSCWRTAHRTGALQRHFARCGSTTCLPPSTPTSAAGRPADPERGFVAPPVTRSPPASAPPVYFSRHSDRAEADIGDDAIGSRLRATGVAVTNHPAGCSMMMFEPGAIRTKTGGPFASSRRSGRHRPHLARAALRLRPMATLLSSVLATSLRTARRAWPASPASRRSGPRGKLDARAGTRRSSRLSRQQPSPYAAERDHPTVGATSVNRRTFVSARSP